jgi:hypothetical protein
MTSGYCRIERRSRLRLAVKRLRAIILLSAHAATFVFLSGAAGTGIISAQGAALGFSLVLDALFFRAESPHDSGGRAPGFQFAGHELHARVDMLEEHLESGAEEIQAGLAVGRV